MRFDMWQFYGQQRPSFALIPKSDQESVWDYPRPPRVERDARQIVITDYDGVTIASSNFVQRLCETASPPQFYIPFADVDISRLVEVAGSSSCEWKGRARYWCLKDKALNQGGAVAWDYPDVNNAYAALRDHLAFYPNRVRCFVDDEPVVPQPGEFYGGWITSELVGPFKGDAGTGHW